ncbi:MAG TPA: hypothetical protein VEA16_01385 [Vicinamibacterales bacterium]|nr:hypothetical protein [Vicinamibacterales bacterium]
MQAAALPRCCDPTAPGGEERDAVVAAVTMPARFRVALRAAGAGRAWLRLRELSRAATDRDYRSRRGDARRKFAAFHDQHAGVLRPPLYPGHGRRPALLVAKNGGGAMRIELALIKGLQMAGFSSTVLSDRGDLEPYYRLAGVTDFVTWSAFEEPLDRGVAAAIVSGISDVEQLLQLEHGPARIGRFAVSATLRRLRTGRIDLTNPSARETLTEALSEGLTRAEASHRLLDALRPELALFLGNRYTGQAELVDTCIARDVDVLAWYHAHRSEALTLKRYHRGNRDEHHASLASSTWERLKQLPWSDAQRAAIRSELHDAYASGDWYRRGATQIDKPIAAPDVVRQQLGIDQAKPTAVIFPHIVWDATVWWGTDLFRDYHEWLVETVRAACANERVNWIVKIHPAHLMKARMQRGADPEAAEVQILRSDVGALPSHVKLVLPDTTLNTYALFPVMDYCITVRGTVGIEAACLGIRVLTAGTGRYDHRGFTLDSESRDEYLHRLRNLHTIPAMSVAEQTLAERYAYGAFVLRPWRLTTWTIDHGEGGEASLHVRLNARTAGDIAGASDMRAFAAWVADRSQEDFLQPLRHGSESCGALTRS